MLYSYLEIKQSRPPTILSIDVIERKSKKLKSKEVPKAAVAPVKRNFLSPSTITEPSTADLEREHNQTLDERLKSIKNWMNANGECSF